MTALTTETTRWLRLQPTDAWFFRDGRPSNRGEDQSDIESQFPPNPATLVGALRAALARQCEHDWDGTSDWPDEIKSVLGNRDDLGRLSFTGPWLQKDGQLLFPMPKHVLGIIDQDSKPRTFKPVDWLVPSRDSLVCNLGEVRLPVPSGLYQVPLGEKGPASTDQFYVTCKGMERILAGTLPDGDDCIHQDELFVLERRVSIARDRQTQTTGQGEIYSPRYVRLIPDVSLLVGIDGLPALGWDVPDYFPLGGESRMAFCETVDPPDFLSAASENSGRVLILITPAFFQQQDGRWYGAGPGDEACQLHTGFSGQVITAAFDRPMGIGGWDSVRGEPLPIAPHVPAGAVWWLDSSIRATAGRAVRIGDRTPHGYGITLVGRAA